MHFSNQHLIRHSNVYIYWAHTELGKITTVLKINENVLSSNLAVVRVLTILQPDSKFKVTCECV